MHLSLWVSVRSRGHAETTKESPVSEVRVFIRHVVGTAVAWQQSDSSKQVRAFNSGLVGRAISGTLKLSSGLEPLPVSRCLPPGNIENTVPAAPRVRLRGVRK